MSTWQILSLGSLAILTVDIAIHLFYGWKSVRLFESCPPFRSDLSEIDLSTAERIAIPSTGGVILRGGVLFPESAPRGVVLFLPEALGSWKTVAIHALDLTAAGFAVVAIDFRNQGESDSMPGYTPIHWASEFELQDALAAVQFIRAEPRLAQLPLGVHGVSRGGCVALALASQDPQIEAVLAQGPFSRDALSLHFGRELLHSLCGPLSRIVPDWHIRLTLMVTYFLSQRRRGCRDLEISHTLPALANRPLLLTVGERDHYVPAHLVRQLATIAGHNENEAVWVVPHARHNQERRVARAEFDRRICDFFQGGLAPRPRLADSSPKMKSHPVQ